MFTRVNSGSSRVARVARPAFRIAVAVAVAGLVRLPLHRYRPASSFIPFSPLDGGGPRPCFHFPGGMRSESDSDLPASVDCRVLRASTYDVVILTFVLQIGFRSFYEVPSGEYEYNRFASQPLNIFDRLSNIEMINQSGRYDRKTDDNTNGYS